MADAALQADILGSELDGDVQAQQLLVAAAHHDLEALQSLLKSVPATVRDDSTGYSALHTAIAALAPENLKADDTESGEGQINCNANPPNQASPEQVQAAEKTVQLLFQNGAIWNDLDANDETPGCLAYRLGLMSLYEMVVDAGVRAELLLNRLDDFEILDDSDDTNDDDGNLTAETGEDAVGDVHQEAAEIAHATNTAIAAQSSDAATSAESEVEPDTPSITVNPSENIDTTTQNTTYLSSALSFTNNKILDASTNAVMMQWETSLMHRSASRILPTPGLSILNIGFGMGIFDTFVQEHCRPSAHHIIEAHPDVLKRMRETGWDKGVEEPDANVQASDKEGVTLHAGTWQEILPRLVEQNITFDAIYFDTFAEDYKAFKEFFSEYVIALLKPEGRWSFFHGLGADRRVCYDVYTKVVEMDLFEAGFEVEWEEVELPELQGGKQEQWKGVKRSYFSVDKYRLTVCKFLS